MAFLIKIDLRVMEDDREIVSLAQQLLGQRRSTPDPLPAPISPSFGVSVFGDF